MFTSAGWKRQHGDKDMLSNWRSPPRPGAKSSEQGAEGWHVPRLPFDERCGVRSDPKDSPGATTANHHEAGEQPLERGAARFSVPAWIPRSRVPTGYYVSTANRRFPEP